MSLRAYSVSQIQAAGGSVSVGPNGEITLDPAAGQIVRVTSDLEVEGNIALSGEDVTLGDNDDLAFGDAPDYWFVYDSANGRFELNSTDRDGGGADGVVWYVDDGSDDLNLLGSMLIAAGEKVVFGGDTNLYRDAANDLKTDDNLDVGGTLSQGGVAVVRETRTLTAGTGLTGGGNLSANRTFNVTLSPFSTSDLSEGSNLYFTDARAVTAVEGAAGIDLSGTLDVTGAVTLDDSLTVNSQFVALGGNPATQGQVRLSNLHQFRWRNAADDGNLLVLRVDGSDIFKLGEDSSLGGVEFGSSGVTTAIQGPLSSTGAATLDTGASGSSFGGALEIAGVVTLSAGGQNYKCVTVGSSGIGLQGQSAGVTSAFSFFSADGDGTDNSGFDIYGVGTPGSLDDRERLRLRYVAGSTRFVIEEEVAGTGTLRDMAVVMGGTDALVVDTSAGVTVENDFQHSGTNLGLYSATPVAQPTTGGTSEAAFVENSGGTAVTDDSTFGGYTLQQIAQALQDIGALA